MQDVCISTWPEGAKTDIVFKVTDICGSNSTDGIPCATPSDIKVDRYAGQAITNSKENSQGDTVPVKIRWFFMKCWANVRLFLFSSPLSRPARNINSSLYLRLAHHLGP